MIKSKPKSGAALRRARGREEMRTAIIEVARQIVAEKGAGHLTIRGIAQELGYSAGSVYEYFEDKEAILDALYFHGANGLGAVLGQMVSGLPAGISASEVLIELGHGYRRYALEHEELYRLMFAGVKERPWSPSDDGAASPGGYGALLGVAQRGIDEGEFVQDVPAGAIALAAWSAVHGFISLELIGHVTHVRPTESPSISAIEALQDRDRMFDILLHMIVRGFANQEDRTELNAS